MLQRSDGGPGELSERASATSDEDLEALPPYEIQEVFAMRSKTPNQPHSTRRRRRAWILGATGAACLAGLALLGSVVLAAQPPVGLGTDGAFAVLAGQAVTNTGSSVVNGDLGVSPGSAVTGFPPGTLNGTEYAANATAAQAELDLTTAYNDAAGRTPATSVPANLGGLTLTAGVYKNASALGLTGALTLNAQGNPNAVFIFQAGSTLITASGSAVNLINGAQPCNVYWQIGSSATLGTTSVFAGNILAYTLPGFATSDETKANAWRLMKALSNWSSRRPGVATISSN